jgi:hypothetical protein
MTGHDPAFLWETEALRTSARRHQPDEAPPGEWVTLQEAHAATGIPVNTLRKWARRGHVDSHVDDTPHGLRRMMRFDSVVEHAAAVEREIAPIDDGPPATPETPPPIAAASSEREAPAPPEAEVAPPHRPGGEEPEPPAPAPTEIAAPPEAEPAPPGTMIVPIDAWNKMLLQLGNLHEAGQQLAEARERAARAETEAAFLKERLSELRAQRGERVDIAAPDAPQPPPEDQTAEWTVTVPGSQPRVAVEPWWVYVSRRWRTRRR